MADIQKEKIGLWGSTSMIIGNMVASGIFLLPATLAMYGAVGILGWVFASIGAIALSYLFAELNNYAPQSIGGPYVFSKLGFGDFIGFLVAWGYWIAIWTTNAAIAVALVGYLKVFLPFLNQSPLYEVGAGLFFLWLFTWVNARPVKTIASVQIVTTVLKIMPILLIGLVGIFFMDWSHFTPFNPSGESLFTAITNATVLCLFAFLGLECASIVSGETEDAQKTVKKATLMGTSITIVVYILSAIAILGLVPPETLALSNAPFADAAERFMGPSARYVVAACAVVATMGALNGWILMQGRIPLAAANDRLFLPFFGQLNRHGSPIKGIVISSILASILMFFSFSESLIEAYTFMIMLSTLSTIVPYLFSSGSLALMAYQSDGPQFSRKILIAIVSFFFCLWLLIGCGQEVVFYGFILLMIGLPVYVYLKKEGRQ